jgi:hypothetical protein
MAIRSLYSFFRAPPVAYLYHTMGVVKGNVMFSEAIKVEKVLIQRFLFQHDYTPITFFFENYGRPSL